MDPKSPRRLRMENLLQRARSSSSSLVSVLPNQSKLCRLCQKIDISILRRGDSIPHGTPSQVYASAAAGCPLCFLLEQHFDLGPERPIRFRGIRRVLSLQETAAMVDEGDIEGLKVITGYDRDDNPYVHNLIFYTHHDDPAASSIDRRPFIKDFNSDESFRLIKSWLDNCVYHHPGCNSPIISQLPTRVLDLGVRGGEQDPVLFTPPNGYKDSYIALSYCWGSTGTRYVLAKSQLEGGARPMFPFSSLPRTLKDAVTITRKLGFRFLWIDALCIIQEGDGGEDIRRETATMHQVYGNATVTIAAAAAASVHDGIFQIPKYTEYREFKIPYDLPGHSTGTAFVDFEHVNKGSERTEAPLNTRAWTFQERILSPRVVLFYKEQITWDCTSRLINSNGPFLSMTKRSQDTPGRCSDHVLAQPSDTSLDTHATYIDYWNRSVEFYSRRLLTNPSDRLKAISGIAQLIHSKINMEYCAGMWLSDIYPTLFWYTLGGSSCTPPTKYIAPSWSWASVAGSISFTLQRKNYWPSATDPDWEPFAKVERGLESSADPFGDAPDARLKIRGQLRVWNFSKMMEAFDGPNVLEAFTFDLPASRGLFFSQEQDLEYFLFFPLPPQIFFLRERTVRQALILEKCGGRYRRIGLYNTLWHVSDMLDTWMKYSRDDPVTVITII